MIQILKPSSDHQIDNFLLASLIKSRIDLLKVDRAGLRDGIATHMVNFHVNPPYISISLHKKPFSKVVAGLSPLNPFRKNHIDEVCLFIEKSLGIKIPIKDDDSISYLYKIANEKPTKLIDGEYVVIYFPTNSIDQTRRKLFEREVEGLMNPSQHLDRR